MDVAKKLLKPVMTNCGMVLPEEGYLEGLRELCDKYGTYIMVMGDIPAHGLKPDFVTGKSIAGGIPVAGGGLQKKSRIKINENLWACRSFRSYGNRCYIAANQFAIAP